MSWLKQIKPVSLYQSSELPYVILEDGVKLCFSNFYSVDRNTEDRFTIEFTVCKSLLERQSASYYKFKKFPVIIPFSDVVKLNSIILHGKVIKTSSYKSSRPLSVALVKSSYVDGLDCRDFDALMDALGSCDRTILLTSDNLGESSHLLMDDVIPVYDAGDWGRVAVAIADSVCPLNGRKYCWTRACPEVSISCFGFDDPDDVSAINDHMSGIGLPSFNVQWSDFDE